MNKARASSSFSPETLQEIIYDGFTDSIQLINQNISSATSSIQPFKSSPALSINKKLFNLTIQQQATPAQQKECPPLIEAGKMIGTFAQMEVGHDTFVHGLQTTATYAPNTDTFIINTPTPSSAKYFPAGFSPTATHAVVMARLVIKDADYAVHSFLVELNPQHESNPSSSVETVYFPIKMAAKPTGSDAGLIIFDNHRIPRANMLMQHASVSATGAYTPRGDRDAVQAEINTSVRHRVTDTLIVQLAKAATIAVRYSVVRTQGLGAHVESPVEVQLMRYKTQHAPILAIVAETYALMFASKTSKTLRAGKGLVEVAGGEGSGKYSRLLSAALKAYTAEAAIQGVERAKGSCGALGSSPLSGLTEIQANVSETAAFESNNADAYQELGRYLLRDIATLERTGAVECVHSSLAYISNLHQHAKIEWPAPDSLNAASLLEQFTMQTARLLYTTSAQLMDASEKERVRLGRRSALNEHALEIVEAGKAHMRLFVLEAFTASVKGIEDGGLREVMMKLTDLWLLGEMQGLPGVGSENLVRTAEEAVSARERVKGLHKGLVREVVALTDAWGFGDEELGSILGVEDGNLNERLVARMREMSEKPAPLMAKL